jgi:hypothetical protein
MKYIILSIFIALGLGSCVKEPNYALEPIIGFENISVDAIEKLGLDNTTRLKADSVTISLNFQDGDGDLGLSKRDLELPANVGKFNFVVDRYIELDGKWYLFNPVPAHSGNFGVLNNGKVGPIKGILNYGFEFLPLVSTKKDKVKFEVYIRDRAGNESNRIETTPVLVNELSNKASIRR